MGATTSFAQDRDSISANGLDSVNYTYTPIATPIDTVAAKDGFFRRFIKYFESANQDMSYVKKLDISFVGGPNYSKNNSFGIGLLASGIYRLDRTDSVTQPSNVTLFASGSVSLFYVLGIMGDNIFRDNKNRINYELAFASAPRKIWGIGYNDAEQDRYGEYVDKSYRVKLNYTHRLFTNTYIGVAGDFLSTKNINFTPEEKLEFIDNQRTQFTSAGLGVIFEYDSRDFIPNPFKGVYVSFKSNIYPEFLSNIDHELWRTEFTANYYKKVWKDAVIATDLYGEFMSQGTPWPMLSKLGTNTRMRGYYLGRYTDNNQVCAQIELRQRIYRRIGAVAWGGAGNVFHSFDQFEWKQTLPNYGIGLRWEFKKRVNIRFDYGFGRHTSGFILNINEAF